MPSPFANSPWSVLVHQTRVRVIAFLPLSLISSFGAEGNSFEKPDGIRSNIGTTVPDAAAGGECGLERQG